MIAKLHNLYGPTEAAIDVTYWECERDYKKKVVPIGRPIANIQTYILDDELRQVPVGETGELHIAGVGLARGYWNRPGLSKEKFIKNPFGDDKSDRLYKTGDLARFLSDGNIEYLGRVDFQVKIRGFRIELGEIEAVLLRHPVVVDATVMASAESLGEKRLVAHLVLDQSRHLSIHELRGFLLNSLPDYMVPGAFVFLDKMPTTPNGKVDRAALPAGRLARPDLEQAYIKPKTNLEKTLCRIWSELLNLDRVGINDNFFDLGGNSLLGMMTTVVLKEQENLDVSIVKLFQYPSISSLAANLESGAKSQTEIDKVFKRSSILRQGKAGLHGEVAIVGMSGRFPGAYDVDELWDHLCQGLETVTFFGREELGPGLDPLLTENPNYVFARGIIPDGDMFDAAFFGINPAEAKIMDPQQRVFLELAWAALENAGYCSDTFDGLIGVYAGMGNNYYLPLNVSTHKDMLRMVGPFPVMVGNEKDHLATRTAHKLNLTGPAVSVHTACSTAMTAIDNAFFSLLTRQCDMALAGGISIQTPRYSGQLYEEGGVFSKDGHCRPFDADATGTMFSDSAGIVVLKRLEDALKDRDCIYAVIKSTALNNDGANKISYLAPSIDGQKQVVAMALARAGVKPESISYIESHGTGTPLGDPIEVEALTQLFRCFTDKKQFCGIGSIKSNLGHPTIAAGVASVIKVALALKNEKIPPTIHYKKANPKIDFENTPFYVVSKLQAWPKSVHARRGGVSAFGFGGTNGHAILEEAPQQEESGPSRPRQLLVLSAKSSKALDAAAQGLAGHLEKHPEINLADAAFTLQNGRARFHHRRFLVCENASKAVEGLVRPHPNLSGSHVLKTQAPEVVFMFPGQGSQYVNMGLNFYRLEPVFKECIDHCAVVLQPHLGCDLREVLYPADKDTSWAEQTLKNTFYQQPAIFIVEVALAKLWNSWGVFPDAMIGHSIGEYACAVLSGVLSLDDALLLVAARGRLMSEMPPGSMLSVRLAADVARKKLVSGVCLAASNGPSLCVVSGPDDRIAKYKVMLEAEGIICKTLHTSHAFHSEMMDPVVRPFRRLVEKTKFNAPGVPFLSTVTTQWVTQQSVCDPAYWVNNLRSPVRFAEAIQKLWEDPLRVLLEVGPRTVTTTLARQQAKDRRKQIAIASLADRADQEKEVESLLNAAGHLWLLGVELHQEKFWQREKRNRIPLPTYSFARIRCWLDPIESASEPVTTDRAPAKKALEPSLPMVESSGKDARCLDNVSQKLFGILEEISGSEFDEGLDPAITFAELGLDSLFLTQITFQLKKQFGVDVTFRQLLEDLVNINKLSEYIKQQAPEHQMQVRTKDAREEDFASFFLPTSFQQEIFRRVKKGGREASLSFNESVSILLTGPSFDLSAMRQAVNQLVDRHEVLRCVYEKGGEKIFVQPRVDMGVSFDDMTGFEKEEIQRRVAALLKQNFNQPFDLTKGPLSRCLVIRLSPDRHQIVLTSHLAICDGWSLDVLVQELGTLYTSIVSSSDPDLQAAESYRLYLKQRAEFSMSDAYKKQANYWQNRFKAPVETLDLPLCEGRPGVRTYTGSRLDLHVDPELVNELKKISGRAGCSFFTLLLAGVNMMLYRLSGQTRLLIGMPNAGQSTANREFLVGNCLSYVPLICEVDPGQSFNDFIRSLRTVILDALEHGRYDFCQLAAGLPRPKDSTRAHFIQVCLNMSPRISSNNLNYHGLDVDVWLNPRYFESFELFINAVTGEADELILEFQYNSDLFAADEVRKWQTWLHSLFENLVKNSAQSLQLVIMKEPAPNKSVQITDPMIRSADFASGILPSPLPPGDHPFYFGPDKEIFGLCHVPKAGKRKTGVLFCPPLAQEYIRSHWAMKLLSNALMQKGLPVMKFDYFGTGDSAGDCNDWDLSRWTQDVVTAVAEMKRRTGVERVSLLGLRFGALLAASALDRQPIHQLVLWDPVTSGNRYLQGLKRMHAESVENTKRRFPFPTDKDLDLLKNEILGFVFSSKLQEEISGISLGEINAAHCHGVDIVVSEDREEYTLLHALFLKMNMASGYHLMQDTGKWDDLFHLEEALLPSEVLQRITDLLDGDSK
jgi:acyl transferase domain-containing protein/pimeloyl-ACP methyl ester carboxylesterase